MSRRRWVRVCCSAAIAASLLADGSCTTASLFCLALWLLIAHRTSPLTPLQLQVVSPVLVVSALPHRPHGTITRPWPVTPAPHCGMGACSSLLYLMQDGRVALLPVAWQPPLMPTPTPFSLLAHASLRRDTPRGTMDFPEYLGTLVSTRKGTASGLGPGTPRPHSCLDTNRQIVAAYTYKRPPPGLSFSVPREHLLSITPPSASLFCLTYTPLGLLRPILAAVTSIERQTSFSPTLPIPSSSPPPAYRIVCSISPSTR